MVLGDRLINSDNSHVHSGKASITESALKIGAKGSTGMNEQ